MNYKVQEVFKAIVCFLIFSLFVTVGGATVVHATIFFSSTVSELQEHLDVAVSNGDSDIILVLPGVYEINSRLSYNDSMSEEGEALFIISLGGVHAPIFRRGEIGEHVLFHIHSNFGGDITVADIIFENSRGGGLTIESEGGGNIGLINCRFTDNYRLGSGAGAYLRCESGTIEVFNNIFQENRCPGQVGGGLVIISRPTLMGYGRLERIPTADNLGHVYLYNNTFLNNDGARGGGLYIQRSHFTTALVYSNIFWGNTGEPRDFYEEFGDPRSPHSDFGNFLYFNQISDFSGPDGGSLVEYQNDDSDPLLDGFIPRPGSPVIDTGPDPAGPLLALWIEPPLYDHRYRPRPVDGNGDGSALIDRGAIEVDGGTGGAPPGPFRPLRVIPDVPNSVGNLSSATVRYVRISDVARNSHNRVGWTISSERSTSKTFALYYGDPAVGNYQTGRGANSGVLKFPKMKFQKGDHPFLYFTLYMDTQRDRKMDVLQVYANNQIIWEKSPRNVRMKEWQLVGVDLNAYASKPVKLAIKFDTIDGRLNCSEGVYIDDIIISLDGSVPAKYLAADITIKAQ